MSLASMIRGNGVALIEGATPEGMLKYDCDNGPLIMAMEAAEALNDVFMEGFYATNDLEISAAMEGYASVMESDEKKTSFKEHVKNALKAVAKFFRNLGEGIANWGANLTGKFNDVISKAEKVVKGAPSNESVTIKGQYRNLDKVADTFAKLDPNVVVGDFEANKKAIGNAGDINAIKVKCSTALESIKNKFGIEGSADTATALNDYFRDNTSFNEEYKITVSDAQKIVADGHKACKSIGARCSSLRKTYDKYATEAEKAASKAEREENNNVAEVWRAMASAANECNSFAVQVMKSWCSAYTSYVKTVANAVQVQLAKGDFRPSAN